MSKIKELASLILEKRDKHKKDAILIELYRELGLEVQEDVDLLQEELSKEIEVIDQLLLPSSLHEIEDRSCLEKSLLSLKRDYECTILRMEKFRREGGGE